MNDKLLKIVDSLLILLCLVALSGGLVYRGYSLNNSGIAISLTLAVISFIIIQYSRFSANQKSCQSARSEVLPEQAEKRKNKNYFQWKRGLLDWLLAIGYLSLMAACFYDLLTHSTAGSIVSPWQVVSKDLFLLYFCASALLIINITAKSKFALLFLVLHYFLSFAVTLVVYRLGYGYDPFIHQATENLIDKNGVVEPKPFYYLGQYALAVIAHKITALPLAWLDKTLVPLAAAVFLPLALWRSLKEWFADERINLLLIFSLLALTFPFLIVTTPQNFAYLLLLVVILLGLACKSLPDFFVILLLSLTALITQPIAGLPALLFCALLAVYHSDKPKFKKYFYPILIIITVVILPILFYFLNQQLAPAALNDGLAQNPGQLTLTIPGQESFVLNFIYLYAFNWKFAFILLVVSGMAIAGKHREQCKIFWLYLATSLALFTSYFITSKIPFAFLINYERGDYAERILLIACLFLLPFIMIAIYALMEKVLARNLIFKLTWASALIFLICAALYLSYPRFDNYYNSRGYSVSASDIKAVNFINEKAGADYIVLANQQVSAASLSQFGFKKYYGDGRLFYYPIPTSSPLYQSYLDMVYKKPSRETMQQAMNLAGVNEGYFVLNKYWWAFKKILDQAKLSADSWQEFDNGAVFVFKYTQ
ncbi:MAG: hypothetical protein PHS62_02915 [Patescibacteria group bacterium]|nr:hypothetical protein [Patescibacteria group bacterium]